MVIERGEIWWATLPDPVGSEPGYRRPVLVVQADSFNQSRIATVIAVVLTSNTKLSKAPGNVLLSRKITGLEKDSVANVSQVITADIAKHPAGKFPHRVRRVFTIQKTPTSRRRTTARFVAVT